MKKKQMITNVENCVKEEFKAMQKALKYLNHSLDENYMMLLQNGAKNQDNKNWITKLNEKHALQIQLANLAKTMTNKLALVGYVEKRYSDQINSNIDKFQTLFVSSSFIYDSMWFYILKKHAKLTEHKFIDLFSQPTIGTKHNFNRLFCEEEPTHNVYFGDLFTTNDYTGNYLQIKMNVWPDLQDDELKNIFPNALVSMIYEFGDVSERYFNFADLVSPGQFQFR